jgi:hypothetical protein
MKDLYRQLGLDSSASRAEIAAALQARPEPGVTAEVLLNDSRRAVYNRAASTIQSIGILRHRLGLDNDQTWFVQNCPDFAPRLHTRKYVAPEQANTASASAEATATEPGKSTAAVAATPTPDSRKSKSWLKAALVIFVLAILMTLSRMFL